MSYLFLLKIFYFNCIFTIGFHPTSVAPHPTTIYPKRYTHTKPAAFLQEKLHTAYVSIPR